MRAGIHPDYQQTTIRCACGAVYPTGSTKKDIRVEVCAKCHPFFTGKQKVVDTGGRVSRFSKSCIENPASCDAGFFLILLDYLFQAGYSMKKGV